MTILEVLIRLRDDIKLWCTNNFNDIRKTISNIKYKKEEVILLASDWGENFPYEISISIDCVTSETDVQVLPNYDWNDDVAEAWRKLQLMCGNTSNGTISLKAYGEKPSIDIPVTLLIGGNIS